MRIIAIIPKIPLQRRVDLRAKFRLVDVANEKFLLTGQFARRQFKLRFAQFQRFGEKFDDRLVRLALLRDLRDADFERPVLKTAQLVASRARLSLHRQDDPFGAYFQIKKRRRAGRNAA